MITLQQFWQQASADLRQAGIEQPTREASLLIRTILKIDALVLLTDDDYILSEPEKAVLSQAIKRRCEHEPFAHIVGSKSFWKHDFLVSNAVLIPRPASETLIEACLDLCAQPPGDILDLGTGSGCLLLSLLTHWSSSSGMGIDISADAIQVAQSNAENMMVDEQRVRWVVQDYLQNCLFKKRFDLIISNPPYIRTSEIVNLEKEVHKYDPYQALDGGQDGLKHYRFIASKLSDLKTPQGLLVLEIGHDQYEAVYDIFAADYEFVACYQDMAGIRRCICWR